jgi:hypothetical protein
VLFNCTQDGNFANGQWIYRTTQVIIDAPLPAQNEPAFGNILFYRRTDTTFLGALRGLLAHCVSPAMCYQYSGKP